jgi:nitrogen fixation NifU-like protein
MTSALSQQELRDLYKELILDHARNPRHFGKIASMTHHADGINPLCGDKLHIYLAIDNDDRIGDAAFEGSGCAISVASASLLTDTVIGLTTAEAMTWFDSVVGTLNGSVDDTAGKLGKLQALEGVREFPSRVKCATLAWHAMKSAVESDSAPATTE